MTDPCDNDFLKELLGVVQESASHMASKQKVRTKVKPENQLLIGLTAKLSDHYRECFQKKPSVSNGGNFRNFMNELSTILSYEFGAETVKAAIKLVKNVRKDLAPAPKKQ
jgi:hypothetical protein